MIESHELKNRDRYLKKLIGFQDTEPVKVITGIRRCGKSSLLKLMIRHLRETGIGQEQIVEMAAERGMAVLSTDLPMFAACGRLYEQGLRGGEMA